MVYEFPSTMAQNFWIAIIAWTACFVVTIVVSLMTKPKPIGELKDLVWGATEMPEDGARAVVQEARRAGGDRGGVLHHVSMSVFW